MTIKNQWLKKPSIDTDSLIKLYNQGLSINQIGAQVGLYGSSVRKRLKKAGVTMRTSALYEGKKRYWLWKGDNYIDPIVRKYNQRKLRKWSKAVRDRDGNKCQDCGTSGRLHAHHLVPIERCIGLTLEFDVQNGVTLCPKCHKARHKLSLD